MLLMSSCVVKAGVKLTLYDDGKSCASHCDAHEAFKSNLIVTKYYHKPNATNQAFTQCPLKQAYEVCFDDEAKEPLTAMYRGLGARLQSFLSRIIIKNKGN